MSKDLVKKGYDTIANHYLANRSNFKNLKHLKLFCTLLPKEAVVLDLGCGAGIPIDAYLIKHGYSVTGLDFSQKQIAMASNNIPDGNFELKDITQLQQYEYRVNGVVSFYTILHIDRNEHQNIFETIATFLPKNGPLLVTMGATEWEGVDDNFHGIKMFWSHFGREKNREIIENAGFEVLLDEIDTSNAEKHQIILATKK